jgi:hypothetical protein
LPYDNDFFNRAENAVTVQMKIGYISLFLNNKVKHWATDRKKGINFVEIVLL